VYDPIAMNNRIETDDLSGPEDDMDSLELRVHLELQGVNIDRMLDRVEKLIQKYKPGYVMKRTTPELKQSRS
jgi:hypothetical protein